MAKTNLERIFDDAVENLEEGEKTALIVALREYLLQTTKDPELREALGGDE